MMPDTGEKRSFSGDGGPPEKKVKGDSEDTAAYSQKIKKKLQANARTGQACDRCKERKMKCDAGPNGCQPCLAKNYRCMATDRITGQAMERGETERLRVDVERLNDEVARYSHQFGPLQPQYSMTGQYQPYAPPVGYHNRTGSANHRQSIPDTSIAPNVIRKRRTETGGPHRGPIYETKIDFMDGELDIGAFRCPDMDDIMKISPALATLNNSRRSSINVIHGAQKPDPPPMPAKEDAIQYIDNFLMVIAPFVPVVHGPTLKQQVIDFYENPGSFDDKPAETAIITVVLAIFTAQMAVRNPKTRQDKLAESNRLFHYALSFFPELLIGDSLQDMQALALFLVHARNLPKPGNSWGLSSMIMARAIELNYHRSATKIELPLEQQNALAIELRKRVFWSILGIQSMIAFKLGRPQAIKMTELDVELPMAVLDTELSEQGLFTRSGKCDFLGHIYLSKIIPLMMDLYENVVLSRKAEAEYIRDLQELDAELNEWHNEWARNTASQRGSGTSGSYQIATHLVELWYAEFRIILHHPRLCMSRSPEVYERNLDICLEASRISLRNVRSMIKEFKGADFTWHFVSGYALAMGMAMHVYNRRKDRNMTTDSFNRMKTELMEWMFVMKSADYFMASGDYLTKFFQPLVQRCLEDAQTVLTASEALRNGYQHTGLASSQANGNAQQAPYVAADTYPPPDGYENNLTATTIPTGNLPAAAQHQQTYGIGAQAPNTAVATNTTPTQPNIATTSTFVPSKTTYQPEPSVYPSPQQPPRTHGTSNPTPYQPQQAPQSYDGAAPGPMMPYLNAVGTGQDAILAELESYGGGAWPMHIVQYQNGAL